MGVHCNVQVDTAETPSVEGSLVVDVEARKFVQLVADAFRSLVCQIVVRVAIAETTDVEEAAELAKVARFATSTLANARKTTLAITWYPFVEMVSRAILDVQSSSFAGPTVSVIKWTNR